MAQNPFKLEVYAEAKDLAKEVFLITKDLTNFRLRDQFFGSASSIAANLSEMGGFSDEGTLKRKVEVCIGECNETQFWTELCQEVGIIDGEKGRYLINKTKQLRMMLFNLLKRIGDSD